VYWSAVVWHYRVLTEANKSYFGLGDKTLDGYQKKKYVCKLLFIFLLGHDIDFGHLEAVNLLSSNKYTEKQIVSVLQSLHLSTVSCRNCFFLSLLSPPLKRWICATAMVCLFVCPFVSRLKCCGRRAAAAETATEWLPLWPWSAPYVSFPVNPL